LAACAIGAAFSFNDMSAHFQRIPQNWPRVQDAVDGKLMVRDAQNNFASQFFYQSK